MKKKTFLLGTIALGMGAGAIAFAIYSYGAVSQMLESFEPDFEEEVDEDLKESFSKQRKLTLEMFQRFNRYN